MPEAVHVGSGKIRELYALDDERLLLVASDRISTFDVVLPTEIPDKGRVLTGLSGFWFSLLRELVPNHMLAIREDGRSMECRKLEMLPIECVVRGYLAGSGWKDYKATGSTSGHALPEGLRESDKLPTPIFTPATKATTGHDENITRDQAAELVGEGRLRDVEAAAIEVYRVAAEHALGAGIIIADTKFEFGLDAARQSRARRRGSDTRLVTLLARRRVRARPRAGQLRQAVRARLLRVDGLGQDVSGPGAPGGGRAGHAGEVRRSVRAADDDPVPGVSRQPVGRPRMKATVLVRPKEGILDPQGDAVERALEHLGFAVSGARVGKVVDLEVTADDEAGAREQVERMCEQLLANPLIESYEIELHV